MVLYDENGRVVKEHETHLEDTALDLASKCRYIEQIQVYKQRDVAVGDNNIRIIIDAQDFKTLYCHRNLGWGSDSEQIEFFSQETDYEIRIDLDRGILKMCSSMADEHFTYNPGENRLHLPVRYPRRHVESKEYNPKEFKASFGDGKVVKGKSLVWPDDGQMAFIRRDEIEKYIFPWLEKVKRICESVKSNKGMAENNPRKRKRAKDASDDGSETDEEPGKLKRGPRKRRNNTNGTGPESGLETDPEPERQTSPEKNPAHDLVKPDGPIPMEIPNDPLEKIHLYNAMLQLGLPKFVQLPLIDALVLQMYQTKLTACHLDTLEMTVGRFYSRGVAVLDPVLNHFIGTYSFREWNDRKPPAWPGTKPPTRDGGAPNEQSDVGPSPGKKGAGKGKDVLPKPVNFDKMKRKYLEYTKQQAQRGKFGKDTYLLPPKLPVLGHSIKHWSGLRSSGSTAAAHIGYPLNIGKDRNFTRRRDGTLGRCVEEDTNRLAGQAYYQTNRPGQLDSLAPPEAIDNPNVEDEEGE
ncbi:hypothetical protein BDW02DRAFT_568722 [Decorospora gaudefroyi]|uniref:Uncharacterized protein n=1 Tax=Decorospora gaudefroyi TaxID=184978 RepID=A0A6A5KGK9_9PLEO|nr:hypothetical protein BDW02DRAFT_568722 [Decorospora gaudefroyi]